MKMASVDAMVPQAYRIRRTRRELSDTFTFELEPEAGGGFRFKAGQFNMLYAFGVGEVPISVSGDPGDDGVLVHTIREVGAVTQALGRLRAGDTVGVRGPFGTPWPVEEAFGSDLVLISGGVGLAPLRPAILQALAHRERFGKLVILYGARTADDILFRKQIEQWRGRFDVKLRVTVDRAQVGWAGNVGVVPNLIAGAGFDPLATAAFVCGPEVMMRYTVSALHQAGVMADQVWVSMERNMKCGIGQCGHCQWGPHFVCKDGPVFRFDRISDLFAIREL